MGIRFSSENLSPTTIINPNEEDSVIPEEFKKKIIKEIILPYYRSNIEYVINTKTGWSKVGVAFFTTSTLLVGASSILSFASGTYPDRNLNFIAGSIGLIALIFKEFASYANSVDHVKTLNINDLLKNIGINHQMKDMSANFEKVIDKNGGSTSVHNDEISAQIAELRGLINEKKNIAEGENNV